MSRQSEAQADGAPPVRGESPLRLGYRLGGREWVGLVVLDSVTFLGLLGRVPAL